MSTRRVTAKFGRPVADSDGVRDHDLAAAQARLLAKLAPATRVRRVAWSEGATQVLELGEGPPLVLLHGGGDNALEWVPIIPALARNHRVIAVDRPGHGLADPFDYRGVNLLEHAHTFIGDILDALDLSKVDILANSMGGLWSVVFALDSMDRVSRIVLAGAVPGVIRAVPIPLRVMGLPLIGLWLGRRMFSTVTPETSRRFWQQLQVAHAERLDDALIDADVAHTRRNLDSILGLLAGLGNFRGLSPHLILGPRWQELKVPTLFLCGDHDAFMTHEMRRAWDDNVAGNLNIRIVPIPDAGHLPWLDQPDRVVGEIERFLGVPVVD